jgi:hypothetical protein
MDVGVVQVAIDIPTIHPAPPLPLTTFLAWKKVSRSTALGGPEGGAAKAPTVNMAADNATPAFFDLEDLPLALATSATATQQLKASFQITRKTWFID